MFEYLGSLNISIGIVVIILISGFLLYRRYRGKQLQTAIADGRVEVLTLKGNNEEDTKIPKYKAWIWDEIRGLYHDNIDKKVGTETMWEPSLPNSGANLYCVKIKEGLKPFDSRTIALTIGDLPTDCYEAVECKEVEQVYVDFTTLWEKFKALVPYIIAGALSIILLVIVDRLMGGG